MEKRRRERAVVSGGVGWRGENLRMVVPVILVALGLVVPGLWRRVWIWKRPSWPSSSSLFSVSGGSSLSLGRMWRGRSSPVRGSCLLLLLRRRYRLCLRRRSGSRLPCIGVLRSRRRFRRLWSVRAIRGTRSRGCMWLHPGWIACP